MGNIVKIRSIFNIQLVNVIENVCLFQSKALNPRSKMRQMWSHPPLAADFKIYLFNVTNPEEAQKGEKVILKEIGPYFYQ